MSVNGDTHSLAGFDGTEHQVSSVLLGYNSSFQLPLQWTEICQAVYIFTPKSALSDDLLQRPQKRRKVGRAREKASDLNGDVESFKLAPLLNEKESPALSRLRLNLFDQYWMETDEKIKVLNSILTSRLNMSLTLQIDNLE